MKLVVALHSFLGGCVVPGLSGDRLQSISIGCLEDMWDTNPQLTLTAPKLDVFPGNLGQATKPVVVLQSFLQLLGRPCCVGTVLRASSLGVWGTQTLNSQAQHPKSMYFLEI